MNIFYNKQAKKILKYLKKNKNSVKIINQELNEILKYDFYIDKHGVFLKYLIEKNKNYNRMFFSTNIENELLINSITIFESSYHNKQEYYTDIMKFMILLIEKFKNVSVEQAMIFSVSFQALEFIVLDNAKFGFMYDDYDENTNSAHIRVYSKGDNDFLTYEKMNEYKTEAIIIFEITPESID